MTTEKEQKPIIPPFLNQCVKSFTAVCEAMPNPLMIVGDTGTGKGYVFLREFERHFLEKQPDAKIRRVNVAMIPETLIEDALFGHDKGAFTGADKERIGLVENHDLLILEEIGTLPQHVQAKLLTFIEDKKYYRVGGDEEKDAEDIQIVATTNMKTIATNSKEEGFRLDFWSRFFRFYIPALWQRRTDVLHYFRHFAPETFPELRPWEIMSLLCYHWPGNVREIMTLAKEIELAIKRRSALRDEMILIDPDGTAPDGAAGRDDQITHAAMLERARAGNWKPQLVKDVENEKKKLLKKIEREKFSRTPYWTDFQDAMRSTITNLEDKCTSFRRSLELNGVDVVFLEKALNTYGLGLDYRSQKTPLKDSDPENFSEHIQEGLTFFCSLFCKDQLSPRDLLSDRTDNRPIHIPYGPRWPDLNQKKLHKLATDCLRYIGIKLNGELPEAEAGRAAFFEAVGIPETDPIPAQETKDAGGNIEQTDEERLRSYYQNLLASNPGNVSAAARKAGVIRTTFVKRLKKLGLK